MSSRLTFEELASLMKSCAGLTVDPRAMQSSPDSTFGDFGLDSLGLLGIVAELENRHGTPLGPDAEQCKSPGALLDLVNDSSKAEA
jgi:minimal PKS acyl carrier protein